MDKNFLLDLCNRINLGQEETQCVIGTLNLEFAKVAAIVKNAVCCLLIRFCILPLNTNAITGKERRFV